MSGFCRHPVTKVVSTLLTVILSGLCVMAAGVSLYMFNEGYYDADTTNYYDTQSFYQITQDYANSAYSHWKNYSRPADEPDNWFTEQDYNFAYVIRHATYTDNILAYNYHPTGDVVEYSYPIGRYVVDCYVRDPIVKKDRYYEDYWLFQTLYPFRVDIPVFAAVGFLVVILALVILAAGAGRRRGIEGVILGWQERIPLDLYLFFAGFVEVLLIAFTLDTIYYYDYWGWIFAGWMTMVICCIGLAILLSVITRFKAGCWWRHTLIHHIIRVGQRWIRALWQMLVALIRAVPLIWKAMLVFCVAVFFNYVLLYSAFYNYNAFPLFLSVVMNLTLFFGVGFAALSMQRLKQAGERLAAGNFEQQVDKKWMVLDFLQHAENLDSIGDGMAIAVQQRMRSERLKTELITNVSHDIKTPLTSIINYIDLLGKETLPEKATEYTAVLERHAKRLKKLTEDIVEASKASTGNMSVILQRTDLCELINQSVGEYAERLEETGLEPVANFPDDPLYIMADGKLLWRVIDNLLGNVCKYGQPGTRVYIDVANQNRQAIVTIKNISRNRLNVAADELIERFVRGDSSRATEGSGLGLNIAQSLVELQKGSFHLAVDGDLFKAELQFAVVD